MSLFLFKLKRGINVNIVVPHHPFLSFCRSDIKLLSSKEGTFPCPKCQRTITISTYPDHFPPKNFGMIEAMAREKEESSVSGTKVVICAECGEQPATIYCSDCPADYCGQCSDANHRPKLMAKHSRVPIEAKATTVAVILCSVHEEKMKLFCVNPACRVPVCVLCSTHGDHKGHECKVLLSFHTCVCVFVSVFIIYRYLYRLL